MQAAGRHGPVGTLWGGSCGDRTEARCWPLRTSAAEEPELCLCVGMGPWDGARRDSEPGLLSRTGPKPGIRNPVQREAVPEDSAHSWLCQKHTKRTISGEMVTPNLSWHEVKVRIRVSHTVPELSN